MATAAAVADDVERTGLRVLVLPKALTLSDFIGVLGRRFGDDLVEAVRGRASNLVVREATEYGGLLGCRATGDVICDPGHRTHDPL